MQPTTHELTDARAIVTAQEVFAYHPHARQVAWMALKAEQGHPITADRERRLQGSGATIHPLIGRNRLLEALARRQNTSALEACARAAGPAVSRAAARHLPADPDGGGAA